MPRSLRDKALAALSEERAKVIKANTSGICLLITASKPDPATLRRDVYRTLIYRHEGAIRRECTCPAARRCYHIELAELLVALGEADEGSER